MQSNSTTDTFTLHTAPSDVTFTGNTATIVYRECKDRYEFEYETYKFTALDASVTSTFTLTITSPTGAPIAIDGVEASSPTGRLPGTGGLAWSPTSTGSLILAFTAPDNTGETIDWNINITSDKFHPVKLTVKIVRL